MLSAWIYLRDLYSSLYDCVIAYGSREGNGSQTRYYSLLMKGRLYPELPRRSEPASLLEQARSNVHVQRYTQQYRVAAARHHCLQLAQEHRSMHVHHRVARANLFDHG